MFQKLDPLTERNLCHEKELFYQIAQGNEKAFERFFNLYKEKLLSYLIRITKSQPAAEELVQEVFLKLWTGRKSLQAVERPEKYVFIMARHKAIDYLRKASLSAKLREDLWQRIKMHSNDTEEQLYAKESKALIYEAVFQLSPRKQEIFRLSRQDGLSHEQIAHELKISKNTVKNHLVESLRYVKNYLWHHLVLVLFIALFP